MLYRLIVVFWWTRRDGIKATEREEMVSFGHAIKHGWSSPSIFLGIIVPVLLTIGPLAYYLGKEANIGEDGVKAISIIVWVPILITLIALIEGAWRIRANNVHLAAQFKRDLPQFATVGISLFAALTAAKIMEELGVGDQLSSLLDAMSPPVGHTHRRGHPGRPRGNAALVHCNRSRYRCARSCGADRRGNRSHCGHRGHPAVHFDRGRFASSRCADLPPQQWPRRTRQRCSSRSSCSSSSR